MRSSDPDVDVTTAAGTRPRSEAATLVFAVTVAVALGVACGIWINSLLASSASAGRAALSRVPPDANAVSRNLVETAEAPGERIEPALTVVEGSASKPAATPVATPFAREASPRPKADARPAATPEVEKSVAPEAEEQRAAPCALYASAASLTMRSGGAAFLVVGGPGEKGSVTVSTPSWADIAVLQETRAANGWVRYAVKSISKRPGLYTVHFATSCGSQTIPVTVR